MQQRISQRFSIWSAVSVKHFKQVVKKTLTLSCKLFGHKQCEVVRHKMQYVYITRIGLSPRINHAYKMNTESWSHLRVNLMKPITDWTYKATDISQQTLFTKEKRNQY